MFLMTGGAVTWRCYKKETISDSKRVSKYIEDNEATKEALCLKTFIGDLGFVPCIVDPIEIFYDNEGAVTLAKEP